MYKEIDEPPRRPRSQFYVFKRHRICYGAVAKVASTTLKWWMAEMDGLVDPAQKRGKQTQRKENLIKNIHQFYNSEASDCMLSSWSSIKAVFNSGEYFCFCMVKNPYARIFSAWANKVLYTNEQNRRRCLRDADFFNSVPANCNDIVSVFEGFLEYLSSHPELLSADHHWTPQAWMVRSDLLPYDLIAKLEEPDRLRAALKEVLGDAYTDPLGGSTPRNKSFLSFHPDFISARAQELIAQLYKDDFSAFSYGLDLPRAKRALVPEQIENDLNSYLKKNMRFNMKTLTKTEEELERIKSHCGAAFMVAMRVLSNTLKRNYISPCWRYIKNILGGRKK